MLSPSLLPPPAPPPPSPAPPSFLLLLPPLLFLLLLQIIRTVDAFIDSAKKLEEDVKSATFEREKEENSQHEAENVLKEAQDALSQSAAELDDLQSRKHDLKELVRIEERNIGYWQDKSNSLYYQFRSVDPSRAPQAQCNG
eukprot:343012-Rhodomonas_salina.1